MSREVSRSKSVEILDAINHVLETKCPNVKMHITIQRRLHGTIVKSNKLYKLRESLVINGYVANKDMIFRDRVTTTTTTCLREK